MPLHPAWVKNISRRVLWAALEKDITRDEREAMLNYFQSSCAYCGTPLTKRWHADHILSIDSGGFNHISNRVPSCAQCNEQEKQERDWLEFLTFKCGPDNKLLEERRLRIDSWKKKHLPDAFPVTEEQRAAWREEVDLLAKAIDASWARLRNIKHR